MKCPLCGSAASPVRGMDDFLVCEGCAEILRPDELVGWSNYFTRRAYRKANR